MKPDGIVQYSHNDKKIELMTLCIEVCDQHNHFYLTITDIESFILADFSHQCMCFSKGKQFLFQLNVEKMNLPFFLSFIEQSGNVSQVSCEQTCASYLSS